jgi:cellulose synthase/poly-beta-1,6-N-acetylglucosamine synthase-like glycosyltransferase
MTATETFTLSSYFFVLVILAVYGWHRYYLVYLYMRNRHNEPKPGPPLQPTPVVTIQLPLYNEMYVAERLIESVCAIDYPQGRTSSTSLGPIVGGSRRERWKKACARPAGSSWPSSTPISRRRPIS